MQQVLKKTNLIDYAAVGKVDVAVIVGSESDLKTVKDSDMLEIFDKVGISYQLSIISAHRNPEELREYCLAAADKNPAVIFICAAGLAAALPGAVASAVRDRPVIGVPLISEAFDGLDSLLAMVRMPRGVPVAVPGIGKTGLHNAAILVCQMRATLSIVKEFVLLDFLQGKNKPAEIGINLPERLKGLEK